MSTLIKTVELRGVEGAYRRLLRPRPSSCGCGREAETARRGGLRHLKGMVGSAVRWPGPSRTGTQSKG